MNDMSLLDQVIQHELTWAQGHKELNLTSIEEILSDDYQHVQPDGSIIGKTELLESYGSGLRYWEIAESSDHHLHLADDLAILIGRWRGKGVNSGIPFDYTARFIAIYRLEDGIWKLIHDRSITDY